MHFDLLDAVNFVISKNIAKKDQIAIMGLSYGGSVNWACWNTRADLGYATLAALSFTPDVFACGIDISGPSNLVAILESIPSVSLDALERGQIERMF